MISFLSCHRPGFSRAHFYRELRKDLSFAQHFALAIEIGADTIAEEILTIVDEQTIHIDQPYYSPLSDNEYVRRYHFVEGLAGDWQDVEIQEHTVPKKFKSYSTPFSSRKGAAEAFDMLFKRFRESVLVVSYSSNSQPTLDEMVAIMAKHESRVEVVPIDYKYSIGNQGR